MTTLPRNFSFTSRYLTFTILLAHSQSQHHCHFLSLWICSRCPWVAHLPYPPDTCGSSIFPPTVTTRDVSRHCQISSWEGTKLPWVHWKHRSQTAKEDREKIMSSEASKVGCRSSPHFCGTTWASYCPPQTSVSLSSSPLTSWGIERVKWVTARYTVGFQLLVCPLPTLGLCQH